VLCNFILTSLFSACFDAINIIAKYLLQRLFVIIHLDWACGMALSFRFHYKGQQLMAKTKEEA